VPAEDRDDWRATPGAPPNFPARFGTLDPAGGGGFAYVYAGLGQRDAAIDCLERAFDERTGGIYGVNGSFLFTGLRSHPRFRALLRRMNLDLLE